VIKPSHQGEVLDNDYQAPGLVEEVYENIVEEK
jgi:hypothetical protein